MESKQFERKVERRKICIFDFMRFCIYPNGKSCSVFSPVYGVSVCHFRRGGNFNTPKKVVDVEPSFSKRSKGRSGSS